MSQWERSDYEDHTDSASMGISQDSTMVGVILVSENREAHEMLKTTRRLLGRTRGITSLILKPGQSVYQMRQQVRKAITKVHSRRILLLTDFFGSTQCNVCRSFVKKGSVELLTGFNLPMLVKLGAVHETLGLKELVPFIEKYGRDHIVHVFRKRTGPS